MSRLDVLLKKAIEILSNTSDSPREDASCLMQKAINKNKAFLYAHPEYLLSDAELNQFETLIKERERGVPVAYLLGQKAFWTLTLKVNPSTLIPREDTELLVSLALKIIPDISKNILDIGTGSGAIALALAKERPDWCIDASDISKEALCIAKENAILNGCENVCFYHSKLFDNLQVKNYDAVISNPPYIRENDRHLSLSDLRFEPINALVSGQDGLDMIRALIQQSPQWLKPSGWLMIEHGYDQAHDVQTLMNNRGFLNISTHYDLANHERVTIGQASDRINIT